MPAKSTAPKITLVQRRALLDEADLGLWGLLTDAASSATTRPSAPGRGSTA